MEYDVFISCKSEDYIYAEEIYDFLTENGINTFLASRELRNLGDSEYRRAITKAMKSTYHMIVFASDASYIDSTWVYYEWDMYINAMLKGFKKGQIVTILKDININDVNMDLWKYESFTYDSYKEKILPYVETPESILRLSEAQKKEQEAENKEQEDLASTIRLSISDLNNNEDHAKILREQILLQISQIKDDERRKELSESLDQIGPLHREISSLQHLAQLSNKYKSEIIELKSELKRRDIDLNRVESQLKTAVERHRYLEYNLNQFDPQRVKKYKKCVHLIYCSIILIIIVICSVIILHMLWII